MSQNKITTFVHNNLVATIIAALIIGGGLSALAFSAYNSGVNSIKDNATATSVSAISSSSTVKPSILSSSILSSSTISSSSSVEAKKEAVNETPKVVEVEKPKAIQDIKPVQITDPQLENQCSPTGFGVDGTFSFNPEIPRSLAARCTLVSTAVGF